MKRLGRAILTVILCIFLVGSGICGAYGVFGGVTTAVAGRGQESLVYSLVFFVPAALGLAIAWGCWKRIGALWRKPPSGAQ